MVVTHNVKGYENFIKFIKGIKKDQPTFILYVGDFLENGKSWCPDCVEASPFIDKALKSVPETYHFVTVEVGDKPFWKNKQCIFRKDYQTNIKVLPTLVKWGTQKRLEGDQLLQNDILAMFFEDKDDE